jgi:hypothetical protein
MHQVNSQMMKLKARASEQVRWLSTLHCYPDQILLVG